MAVATSSRMSGVTIAQARKRLAESLGSVAHEEAESQATELIASIVGCDTLEVLFRGNEELSEAAIDKLASMEKRRLAGEPLQYILGEWELMGLGFYVTPDVLIPRQDTETVIEAALKEIKKRDCRTALDMCCGTGCIGISLAVLGKVEATICDISEHCIRLSQKNADRNGVVVRTVQTDLFYGIQGEKYDIIVCNPPYIPRDELISLQMELTYEPVLALDGGEDGLDFYRRIAACFREHLNDGGVLVLEIGYNQAEAVCEIFGTGNVIADICGNPRCVVVER